MNETPYYNAGAETVYIGGRAVQPGDTRMVESRHLHKQDAKAPAVEPVAEANDERADIDLLLEGTVPSIKDAITARNAAGEPTVPDDDLALIAAAEEAGEARKTLLEAIREEQIERASNRVGE